MTGGVLRVLLLAAIYAIALGSARPLDLLGGAVLGTAVLAVTGQLGGQAAVRTARRLAAFPPWALVVAGEVALGVWQVARVTIRLRDAPRAGIVAIPVADRSRQGVAVTALASTLSPGELLIDVDWERRLIFIHVLDARDPEAVRRRHEAIYERHQREVFP